jgi:NitT/TauT family transport system permease protein
MNKTLSNVISVVGVFLAVMLLWYSIIWIGKVPAFMLPGPVDIIKAAIEKHQSLLFALRVTATTAIIGFAASLVVGILVAILFAESPWVRRMLYPYTVILQTVPIVAIAPLIIMWVGSGPVSVTLVTFIVCVSPIIANTTQGLISVEKNLLDLFLMNNASRGQILWKLKLPNSIPSLMVGARISAGLSSIGAIVGELFTGSNRVGEGGLGYSITYANSQLQTDYLFSLVGTATGLGLSFVFIIMFFEWLFLHNWHESARPQLAE